MPVLQHSIQPQLLNGRFQLLKGGFQLLKVV